MRALIILLRLCRSGIQLDNNPTLLPARFQSSIHAYASTMDIPMPMYLLWSIGTAVYLLGGIFFYRLLCLYEKGVIFSGANVSEMKKLGSCMAGYGILAVVVDIIHLKGIVLLWVLLEGFVSPWIVIGGAILHCRVDHGRRPENSGGTGTDRLSLCPSSSISTWFSPSAKCG